MTPASRHPRWLTLRLGPALLAGLLAACGGGGGGGGGDASGNAGGGPTAGTLADEIARTFPHVPDQPFEVSYACQRSNSALLYFFYLWRDGSFHVDVELDNHDEVRFGGTYTYAGGAIRLQALSNPVLPLDETTTTLVMRLGLVGGFDTPTMRCVAMGHGENPPATEGYRAFGCPTVRMGPASDEENAFEFVHNAVPFDLPVAGSIFRQRDTYVSGNNQPLVRRGYGIYRRVGDRFYADFAGAFDDHDPISGRFATGDTAITVDQLPQGASPCPRR